MTYVVVRDPANIGKPLIGRIRAADRDAALREAGPGAFVMEIPRAMEMVASIAALAAEELDQAQRRG